MISGAASSRDSEHQSVALVYSSIRGLVPCVNDPSTTVNAKLAVSPLELTTLSLSVMGILLPLGWNTVASVSSSMCLTSCTCESGIVAKKHGDVSDCFVQNTMHGSVCSNSASNQCMRTSAIIKRAVVTTEDTFAMVCQLKELEVLTQHRTDVDVFRLLLDCVFWVFPLHQPVEKNVSYRR